MPNHWFGPGSGGLNINTGAGQATGYGNGNSQIMCSASASSGSDAVKGSSLGTGFGETKYAPVHTVEFERSTDQPYCTFVIYYNTRERLADMGVEFKKALNVAPSAFPNESGYCKPPEGWKR